MARIDRRWVVVTVLVGCFGCGVGDQIVTAEEPLPDCEWCGAEEAPGELDWKVTLASEDEPGRRMVLEGSVFHDDGTTPASGILLYMYQTNHEGIYAKRGDETGNGRRHGYLRGWVLTGDDGRYMVSTIKPMPYPGRSEPAHIHFTVKEPGREEYWIDSVVFDDDPLLTETHRLRLKNLGGSGIVTMKPDDSGTLHATRDIILQP